MRFALLVPLVLLTGTLRTTAAQDAPPFATFEAFTDSLATLAAIPDAAERDASISALWNDLAAADQIPFRLGDEAAILWRGAASTVQIAGDHNGWNPNAGTLARVGLSDVWMRTYTFPEAARVDYKLVADGRWILDPANPHQQFSGVGTYNSELRMPAWVFPDETVRGPDLPAGTFSPNQTIASTNLGYDVRYRVYTPAEYSAGLSDLPVLYVTDGHEYSDDRLGAARIVLDNLIAERRIEPTLAVFIDPRVGGQNRRQELYVQNPGFAAFVADELVPAVDAAFATRPDRDSRVILGTSLGGLFSAYLGVLHPETFGKLAIQSPSFWVSENPGWWEGPPIYDLVAGAEAGLFEVHMSTGTINDTEDGARQMRDVFEAGGHALGYREVPEGHSWGNWRALLDDALLALLPGRATATEEGAEPVDGLTLALYPNPATGPVAFTFTLDAPARTRLTCFDVLGRRSHVLVSDTLLGTGRHAVEATLPTAGTHLCRLQAGEQLATRTVTVVR